MMNSESSRILTDLNALFDEERDVLIHGRFGDLAALTERKAALLAVLHGIGGFDDGPVLDSIRRRADGASRLLAASISGLRAAARRIDTILRAGHSLDTYDRLGRSDIISTAAPDVERRA
jgi:hypothetical protein